MLVIYSNDKETIVFDKNNEKHMKKQWFGKKSIRKSCEYSRTETDGCVIVNSQIHTHISPI